MLLNDGHRRLVALADRSASARSTATERVDRINTAFARMWRAQRWWDCPSQGNHSDSVVFAREWRRNQRESVRKLRVAQIAHRDAAEHWRKHRVGAGVFLHGLVWWLTEGIFRPWVYWEITGVLVGVDLNLNIKCCFTWVQRKRMSREEKKERQIV